jgi:hypothetical protein
MRKLQTWKHPNGYWAVVDMDADICVGDCLPTQEIAYALKKMLDEEFKYCENDHPAIIALEKLTYKPDQGAQ